MKIPDRIIKARREEYAKLGIYASDEQPQEPGLFRKTMNFTKAAVKHVASGRPIALQEVVDERLAICRTCPSKLYKIKLVQEIPPQLRHLEEVGTCLHKTCGCYLHDAGDIFPNKLAWADQACPLGHWTAEKERIKP